MFSTNTSSRNYMRMFEKTLLLKVNIQDNQTRNDYRIK